MLVEIKAIVRSSSVVDVQKALMRQMPGSEGEHLGLLLQLGQVSQVFLRDNPSLQAAGTEDGLELQGRGIRRASQCVEDDLGW